MILPSTSDRPELAETTTILQETTHLENTSLRPRDENWGFTHSSASWNSYTNQTERAIICISWVVRYLYTTGCHHEPSLYVCEIYTIIYIYSSVSNISHTYQMQLICIHTVSTQIYVAYSVDTLVVPKVVYQNRIWMCSLALSSTSELRMLCVPCMSREWTSIFKSNHRCIPRPDVPLRMEHLCYNHEIDSDCTQDQQLGRKSQ